jgi:radical SAM-linked protein
MTRRVPEGPPPPPVVARLRVQYAKRGRLRFVSHRDFARAFERALRRAGVPIAYSAGFTPHPKVSYVGAAPTGVASEAEYLEIGLARACDAEDVRAALDAALPDGLDVVAVVPAGPGSLAERIEASRWQITLTGVSPDTAHRALVTMLAEPQVLVERVTKAGPRQVDVRGPIESARVVDLRPAAEPGDGPGAAGDRAGEQPGRGAGEHLAEQPHAILDLVVRQVTPAVRPDDVVTALRLVAGLALVAPPVSVRLAQGPLDEAGNIGDPLGPDRAAAATAS